MKGMTKAHVFRPGVGKHFLATICQVVDILGFAGHTLCLNYLVGHCNMKAAADAAYMWLCATKTSRTDAEI